MEMESASARESPGGNAEYRMPKERRAGNSSKRQGLKHWKAAENEKKKKKLAFAAQHYVIGQNNHQELGLDDNFRKELKIEDSPGKAQVDTSDYHSYSSPSPNATTECPQQVKSTDISFANEKCGRPPYSEERNEMSHSSSSARESNDTDSEQNDGIPPDSFQLDLQEELQKMWRLTTSFMIRPPVSLPFLVGWEQDDKVLLRDLWSDEVYITNLRDGLTTEVFINQLKGDVFHCATLGDDRMVYCDSRSGLVHVCRTSDGQHLKTIATTHRPSTHMYSVAVDHRGHIIFGVRDGTIFVIDPEESKIISSFNVDCKIDKLIATSSGYVVIRSGIAKLNVVRDGNVVHTITDPDWCWATCVAHPIQDLIYVAYSKQTDGSNRRIMTIRPTGEVLKDDVLELGDAPHRFMRPSMIITKSGKIIVCDNGQLLVYELKDNS